MTINRSTEYLLGLLNELRRLPRETEWVEFKHNNDNPEEIGEYLSTLANAARLIWCHDESVGSKARKYLPWWA